MIKHTMKKVSSNVLEYRGRRIVRTMHFGEPRYSVARTQDGKPGGVDESLRGLRQWIDRFA